MLMTLPVWVGDYAAVTHPLIPDITTGSKGITNRIYEVVDRQPDYANGRMGYKLLDTGLTGAPVASGEDHPPIHSSSTVRRFTEETMAKKDAIKDEIKHIVQEVSEEVPTFTLRADHAGHLRALMAALHELPEEERSLECADLFGNSTCMRRLIGESHPFRAARVHRAAG